MDALPSKHQNILKSVIPEIGSYDDKLNTLSKWWSKISLIGKINSRNVSSSILDEMHATKQKFSQLQISLIESLLNEHWQKRVADDRNKSQVAIDILIRNLFERTADVGFLATDEDIREFLKKEEPTTDEQAVIRNRLQEYVSKYSVYDEVFIFDCHGKVQANLKETNSVTFSDDPLIAQTLATKEDYIETYRYIDMRPDQAQSLIYSCVINDSNESNAKAIGVLCLCFRFEDEMQDIFNDLLSNSKSIINLVDRQGKIIASSNKQLCSIGVSLPQSTSIDVLQYKGLNYLSTVTPTTGYQGFYGLGWSGQVMTPLDDAFIQEDRGEGIAQKVLDDMLQSDLFSDELKEINRTSTLVMDDLSLVVLNGIIASARQNAVEFMPVLEEIKSIGENITSVFTNSIYNLLSTVVDSRIEDVKFRAGLAVDLMDRNLYERANDCRWWALTSAFQEVLSKQVVSVSDQQDISSILSYINELYTVYTNLYLYDTQGKIIAVSNEEQSSLIGVRLESLSGFSVDSSNKNSQKYTVSDFLPSSLYGERHTYIYNATITDPNQESIVGGIGIVFDSTPEFDAMLTDTLPKDGDSNVQRGCFAVYCQRDGLIVSATEHSPQKEGEKLVLGNSLFEVENGQQSSEIITFNDKRYVVGVAASKGYREYKTTSDYTNDILAFIFVAC